MKHRKHHSCRVKTVDESLLPIAFKYINAVVGRAMPRNLSVYVINTILSFSDDEPVPYFDRRPPDLVEGSPNDLSNNAGIPLMVCLINRLD